MLEWIIICKFGFKESLAVFFSVKLKTRPFFGAQSKAWPLQHNLLYSYNTDSHKDICSSYPFKIVVAVWGITSHHALYKLTSVLVLHIKLSEISQLFVGLHIQSCTAIFGVDMVFHIYFHLDCLLS